MGILAVRAEDRWRRTSCALMDDGQVKQLPPGLPPASSPAWHNRRSWDELGYLRVRSLANPSWHRDMAWLIRWLRRESPPVGDPLHASYDAAIAAARRYQHLATRAAGDLDAAWDEVLTPIDDILARRHREHLDRVADAGISGHDVPPPAS